MPADPSGPLDLENAILPDGGPVYTETNLDRWIVEPWNAASALLFLVIVVVWLVRSWGEFRQHRFLLACLPLLALGGVGGTLYHAFRVATVFFLLDVVPIILLVLAVSLYLWIRLRPRWYYVAVVLFLVLILRAPPDTVTRQQRITLSYVSMGILMLLPVLFVLGRTHFRHGLWVVLALASFGVALFFRLADAWHPPLLPMGTHWLWHLFGAGSTAFVAEYLYRLEPEPLQPRGEWSDG